MSNQRSSSDRAPYLLKHWQQEYSQTPHGCAVCNGGTGDDAGLQVAPEHRLGAPNSIRSEALELLLRDVRAGKRTEQAALEAHERMTEMKIRLVGDRVSRRAAWQVARRRDWDTLRAAEYPAITRLQADARVTVHPRLAAVARGTVDVAAIDDLLTTG